MARAAGSPMTGGWFPRLPAARFPPNSILAVKNTLGRAFGGINNPCGNGDAHSLGFPDTVCVFRYGKNLGACFYSIKSPCGNGHTHSLGFPHKISFFRYGTTLEIWSIKSPCGNGHTHLLVLGKYRSRTPVSNPVPPGCVVRVPAHWAIWRRCPFCWSA